MEGQMWPEERKFLYNAVRERQPSLALEVGTWKGGGSTLQITTALQDNCGGILHTCEVNPDFYQEAIIGFANTSLNQHVQFYHQSSTELIKHLIQTQQINRIGFVFFDGPEDPQLNIDDFKLLDSHLAVGTYFCMHDWDLGIRPDGLISVKAILIRPYLEQLSTWQILRTLTAPVSVGIVLAKKIA